MIKVFGEDVLIHETLTKKVSKIYLSENDFKDNKNTFFITEAKILDVGQDATEVPIGTQALFKDFASNLLTLLESLILYHANTIIVSCFLRFHQQHQILSYNQ